MKRLISVLLGRTAFSVVSLLLCLTAEARAANRVIAWGANNHSQTNVPSGLTNLVAIAAGGDHTLALRQDGTVVAWGRNLSGQTNVPAGLSNVVAIAAGNEDSLALTADGTVVVWGSNGSGQGAVPPGLNNVASIAAGMGHHLAVRRDGTVVAWGNNVEKQTQVPVGLRKIMAVAGGAYHSLALRKEGTVVAWGADPAAMGLPGGLGESFGQTNVPVGLSNVIAIAAGSYHNVALRDDGSIVGWGRNDRGQLNAPPHATNVVAITAGDGYSLALKSNGALVFWGYDYFQLSGRANSVSNAVAISAGSSHCVALVNEGEPVIVRSPASQAIYEGMNVTFQTHSLGESPLEYRWRLNGQPLGNGTNAWFSLSSADSDDAGTYTLTVSNAHGWTASSGVLLTVITNPGVPFVLSQPCDGQTVAGSSARFAVEAGGTLPLYFRWLFNHTNLIGGATNDLLELSNVQPSQAGIYSVEVSNVFGTVVSADSALSFVTNVAWVFKTARYVFSSPAIAPDGTVYLGSADSNIYAMTAQGVKKWAFATGAEVQSSPAIGTDGTIYVGSGDSYLYAIYPNGTQRWRFKTGDFILSSPALGADGTIYVNSRDGKLYAVNSDGTKQWEFSTGQYYNDMPAVIGPDATIYLGAAGKVQALNLQGQKKWEASAGGSSGNVSVVIGNNGSVYATSGGDGMKMVALTYDGKKLWEFPFGNPTAAVNPSYPAIGSDGTIYIATADSFLYAINPNGTLKWKTPATRTQSSPALSSDGKIYLNSDWDFRLLCFDTTGTFQWDYILGGSGISGLISSFPTLLHGVLYFGSGNGNVYAYNVSGELAGGAWPAFGRDAQHSNRDIQRRIEATISPISSAEELKFVVELNRSYRLQGTSNFLDWVDCQSFISTNAFLSLPKPAGFSCFRLVSP